MRNETVTTDRCNEPHASEPDDLTGTFHTLRERMDAVVVHARHERISVEAETSAMYRGSWEDPMVGGGWLEAQLLDGEFAGQCVLLLVPWGLASRVTPVHYLQPHRS